MAVKAPVTDCYPTYLRIHTSLQSYLPTYPEPMKQALLISRILLPTLLWRQDTRNQDGGNLWFTMNGHVKVKCAPHCIADLE